MNEFLIGSVMIAATIGLYSIALVIYKKYKSPLLQPILIVSAVIIFIMLIFKIPYETYMLGGQWIELFMGPAVVALALPLYNHFDRLKSLALPIVTGVSIGAVVGVLTGIVFAKLAGFEREPILAIVPKSVTTPVAVSIAETLEGPMSLAAVFVIIAGVSGVLMRPLILRFFKLKSPLGRGIGMGSASHAIGTASSMGNSELEGSFSTIAMVLSAVIVSFIAPLFVLWLL